MNVHDIGTFVSDVVDKYGFYVDRNYCGHGIGHLFHCNPTIPHTRSKHLMECVNVDNHGKGKIRPGMIFTIESMVNAGNPNDTLWPDKWTVATTDGKRSAQFEHTLLVTEEGCEILTASPKFYDVSKPVMEMLPFDRKMFQRESSVC